MASVIYRTYLMSVTVTLVTEIVMLNQVLQVEGQTSAGISGEVVNIR